MLDRKEVLLLKAWGSVPNGGRLSKNLAEVQAEYQRRMAEDRQKAVLVQQQRKNVAAQKGRK
jgi:hypothetical protein